VLRLVVGLLLAGHGAQKLFGWYGGHGIAGTGKFFEQLGYKPGKVNAALAGLGEGLGGLLLAIGFLTPLAVAALVAVMINAIASVHAPNGLWVTEGGYEYNLVLIASALLVAFAGPGAVSFDHGLGWHLQGMIWGFGALVLGTLGASVTLVSRDQTAAEADAGEDAETKAA
jgi:putative oxidoreductase